MRAITNERNVWLHVDAAYAGPAAILPEFRSLLDAAHGADSIVLNPHKWLFVPIDLSVLYIRHLDLLRRTFSLAADYLDIPETGVHNYMDYGLQLGRRFRALKLWFAIRTYGVHGLQTHLRSHIALSRKNSRRGVAAESGCEIAGAASTLRRVFPFRAVRHERYCDGCPQRRCNGRCERRRPYLHLGDEVAWPRGAAAGDRKRAHDARRRRARVGTFFEQPQHVCDNARGHVSAIRQAGQVFVPEAVGGNELSGQRAPAGAFRTVPLCLSRFVGLSIWRKTR